jgi:hypothetical protein
MKRKRELGRRARTASTTSIAPAMIRRACSMLTSVLLSR